MHNDELPPITEAPAAHLAGRQLGNGWYVKTRLQKHEHGGACYSVPYLVENTQGKEAFMKALNVAAVIRSGEGKLVDRMKHFADTYVHERDLFAQCRERRMSRVIKLLDAGEVDVPEAGILSEVPYLIFELAEGDLRDFQAKLGDFDLVWVLRTLKHIAQGIEQLHSAQAAHQDLNSTNVLTTDDGLEMKIGDLGRAARFGVRGPNTDRKVAGASPYAPPEQLYESFDGSWELRRAGDLYQLGSIATELFLGQSMTSLVQMELPPILRYGQYAGRFSQVRPHLIAAHGKVILELEAVVAARSGRKTMGAEIAAAVAQLTYPDPEYRGHPRDRFAVTSSYSVRRFVSFFNRMLAEAQAPPLRR